MVQLRGSGSAVAAVGGTGVVVVEVVVMFVAAFVATVAGASQYCSSHRTRKNWCCEGETLWHCSMVHWQDD